MARARKGGCSAGQPIRVPPRHSSRPRLHVRVRLRLFPVPLAGQRHRPVAATAPGIAHEELKVIVVIDRGRNVRVVLGELLSGHEAVVAGALKLREEVLECGILAHPPGHNFWVLADVVHVLDVEHLYPVIGIAVEEVEGRVDELLPPRGNRPAHGAQELGAVDGAGTVPIDGGHQQHQVSPHEVQPEAPRCCLKLRSGHLHVPTGVHDPECAAKLVDAMGAAPRQDNPSELRQHHRRQVHGLRWSMSSGSRGSWQGWWL
mmetsp:Transcript_98916/g.314020  ORF Transcript_98916/g.314020 Transcript_98916/m.314020 type:complete len:260 (-) Transcript_98916:405-1184(-)